MTLKNIFRLVFGTVTFTGALTAFATLSMATGIVMFVIMQVFFQMSFTEQEALRWAAPFGLMGLKVSYDEPESALDNHVDCLVMGDDGTGPQQYLIQCAVQYGAEEGCETKKPKTVK